MKDMIRHLSVLTLLLVAKPLLASHLVTGNGYGFAVVTPENGHVTKFYAHPYGYTGPDVANPLAEGVETANLIDSLELLDAGATRPRVNYQNDSQMIHVRWEKAGFTAFMPFELHYSALALVGDARKGDSRYALHWAHRLNDATRLDNNYENAWLLRFAGVEESLLAIQMEPLGKHEHVKFSRGGSEQRLSGDWVLMTLESGERPEDAVRAYEAWRSGASSAAALMEQEYAALERWRVRPNVRFASEAERHLWRESEVMLRMAQSRERNRVGRYSNGMIVACLPDGAFATHWVRDMAWATEALIKMGHKEEARAAILAYFNARPTGVMRNMAADADYQISVVRYFGNGAEEPFFTMEGAANVEFDNWGEVLWVLGEYLNNFHDVDILKETTARGSLYLSARDFIVKPLMANFENHGAGEIVAADTSIWEEHQADKKHFAFSTAMAIEGLALFAPVARMEGDEEEAMLLDEHVKKLGAGFAVAFVQSGVLKGTLEVGEKNEVDGALVAIGNFAMQSHGQTGLPSGRRLMEDLLARMELLKVSSGGYRRVRSNYTDPAIYEYWYEREEFVFVDLAWAELNWRVGEREAGDRMLARITEKAAADNNIVPEMYVAVPCKLFPGEIGDPTGAIPMVGYAAGAYILAIEARADAGLKRKAERWQ